MPKITNKCIELIKNSEGLRLNAYKCPAGEWTIGYGCRIRDKYNNFVPNSVNISDLPFQTISIQTAETLLLQNIQEIEKNIKLRFKNINKLNDFQYSAFVSLCYNVGVSGIGSGLRNFIENDCNNPKIKDIWMQYNKMNKLVSNGLIKRRAEELEVYFTPQEAENNFFF